jgi:L-aminopeptidase/D-esterase-like protein
LRRRLQGGYIVGVLVQANFGTAINCCSRGAGQAQSYQKANLSYPKDGALQDSGSIVAVVATDAPLLPHQLERLAKAPRWGWRTGGMAGNTPAIFIAFLRQILALLGPMERISQVNAFKQRNHPLFN